MARTLYVTIDTLKMNIDSPDNFEVSLENCDLERYSRIRLKQMVILHDTDTSEIFRFFGVDIRPIYVHCNLLNKDDNIVNGQQSNVIFILSPDTRSFKKVLTKRLPGNSSRLLKHDNKLRLLLTDRDGTALEHAQQFSFIFDFEFS